MVTDDVVVMLTPFGQTLQGKEASSGFYGRIQTRAS
jgi:hypothetical protein